ncbi:MAG: hypothetical protein Q8N98_01630 [bacterium]|nr:hypothetical protein [bacterium]
MPTIIEASKPSDQMLSQQVAEVMARAKALGVPCYQHFAADLSGRAGDETGNNKISRVGAILDLVESGQPGIVTESRYGGGRGLLVVQPEGEFAWRGFSGVLLDASFQADDRSPSVSVDRSYPNGFASYDDNIETILLVEDSRGQTINVNFGNTPNLAEYSDGRLVLLTFQKYNDSTSSYRLVTAYNQATSLWESNYTPAYGRQTYPLAPASGAVLYTERPGDNQTIQLASRSVDGDSLTLEIMKTENGGKLWRHTVAAPLTFPRYLIPSVNFDEYLRLLTDSWSTTYPELCKRAPVITEQVALVSG